MWRGILKALITVDQLYAAVICENAEMFCFENPQLSLDVEIKHRKSEFSMMLQVVWWEAVIFYVC